MKTASPGAGRATLASMTGTGTATHMDQESARLIARTCDPITLARHPDLEQRIMYAFIHVTHGYMESWWQRECPRIVESVACETGVDWGTAEWRALAAMHAVIICDTPVTPTVVQALAYQAALVYLTEQENNR